jgi:hypothetical protein
MMVFGAGYRLLPMLLPSRPPRGHGPGISACVLEIGILGAFASLLTGSRLVAVATALVLVGVGVFLSQVVSMMWRRLPPGRGVPTPDFPRAHALQALLYLSLCAGLGLALAVAPAAEWKLRIAPVYATMGLLGFLGQMILGVAARQLPVLLWIHATKNQQPPPISPYRLLHRGVSFSELTLWTLGVPVLAAGFWLESPSAIRTGALLLAVATAASAFNFRYAAKVLASTRSLRSAPG